MSNRLRDALNQVQAAVKLHARALSRLEEGRLAHGLLVSVGGGRVEHAVPALQRRTHKADLKDVLYVHRRHRASNVSLVPDQTFLFQLAQRLPNRTAADTQQLCHLVFLNSFTGFEFSLENLPPDLVRHFLPQGFIV